MTWPRRHLAAVGLAAMLGALLSLALPLHLDAFNRYGATLTCGNALHFDATAVVAEDEVNAARHARNSARYQRSDYTGECEQWIGLRRQAAGAVFTGGAAVAIAALVFLHPRRRRVGKVVSHGCTWLRSATTIQWTGRLDERPTRSRN